MKKFLWLFIVYCFNLINAQNLNLIPYPKKVELKDGFFDSKQVFFVDKNSFTQFPVFKNSLKKNTIQVETTENKSKLNFTFELLSPDISGDYYELDINPKSIHIKSNSEQGQFYGFQTLLQLIQTSKDGKIPALEIRDSPTFDYRGMHLDVVRHFFTVEEVKKYLDYLAMYKYNKFHWHLTDDQGWRIEIKKYPKLTEIGAWRNGSQIGPYADLKFDDKKYGGFYTQEQIKEVVEYAKKLHIDIIPEIEMPGHSVAAIASYPELSCMKGNFQVGKKWGVEENILCPTEYTFEFLENVLDEVAELFPYEYIHIGGDEAPKKAWKESEFCQNLIKKLNLKDEHELQSYFITRIEKYLNSKGKKIIGWDEILQGGLAPNATVMSWSGIEGGIQAAKSGHKAIMTPSSSNYFDHYQGNPETEPLAFGGDTRLEKVYRYHPIPEELNAEEAKYIWGTQGNLWTEYITSFKGVEYMIFPRMMALSEVSWGSAKPEEYTDFKKRVKKHFTILDQENINYSKAIFEIEGKAKTENGTIFYELISDENPQNIRFTTNGTDPDVNSLRYENPIEIKKSQTIKAAYFENGKRISSIISQEFTFSKSTGKKLTLGFPASKNYSDGNEKILTDGIFGNTKYFGKNWLGFSGNDCIATIDLGEKMKISNVGFTALDRKGSWIYLPKSAKVFVSGNGKDFKEIKQISQSEITAHNGKININFPEKNTSFIKIKIENFGIIPDGNEGAGNKAWLFLDEIFVN